MSVCPAGRKISLPPPSSNYRVVRWSRRLGEGKTSCSTYFFYYPAVRPFALEWMTGSVRSPVLTAAGRNWPPLPNADATAVVFVAVTQPEETAATEKIRGGPENPSLARRSFKGATFSAVTLLWLWMSPGREGEVKGVSGSVRAAIGRTDGRSNGESGDRFLLVASRPTERRCPRWKRRRRRNKSTNEPSERRR